MYDTFKIDSKALKDYCKLHSIGALQLGLFFNCLFICWESEKRGNSLKSAKALSFELGVEESDISLLVSVFFEGGWLKEELCLDTFETYVTSPYLVEEHKNNLLKIERKNQETKLAKREREIAEVSLVKLIKTKPMADVEPTVAFLKVEDRETYVYQGWLPTNRFNQNGQVFRVTESLIEDLKSEYPFADISTSILAIHGWLARNTTKRKTLAKMPEFIRSWIKNSSTNINTSNNDVDFSAIEQQLDKLFG